MNKDKTSPSTVKSDMQMFRSEFIPLLKEALSNELQGLAQRNSQQRRLLKCLEAHLVKHGHLHHVDDRTGEIVLDTTGFPIPLEIPMTEKSRIELVLKQYSALEALTAEEEASLASSTSKVPLNFADYAYLLKTNDDDDKTGTE